MTGKTTTPETPPQPSERPGLDWRLIAVVLVITLGPFLLFASHVESLVRSAAERPMPFATVWALVAALLWADILLPIPSSVVTTFAGAKLGWFHAFLASNTGMMFAALTAFGLGRFAASIKLARLTAEQQHAAAAGVEKWGPWAIVISRGIPMVAEIVLIYLAAQRIPFRSFFLSVLAANTAISLGYAILGQWAADREWLAVVLGASGILPLLFGLAVRKRLERG